MGEALVFRYLPPISLYRKMCRALADFPGINFLLEQPDRFFVVAFLSGMQRGRFG